MKNYERDLQFLRQCTPQGIAYMSGYENNYGVYGVYTNGCYVQGNGIGHGYGYGWNGHGIGHGYGWNGHGMGYMYGHGNCFASQVQDHTNKSSVAFSLNENHKRETDRRLGELHLQLKKERDEKSKKETEFNALLKSYGDVSKENKELVAETSRLTAALAEIKLNESAHLAEMTQVKQEIVKLEDVVLNLNDDLTKARADANSLNMLNEKLLKDNEERDETIAHYRKKLANYTLKGWSSDRDSLLDNNRETKQTRRFGARALHALTALGAENTMGPWFCIPCGTNGSPLQFPTYSEYRRHLIEVDRKTIDPSLCKLCGWRCVTPWKMETHLETHH